MGSRRPTPDEPKVAWGAPSLLILKVKQVPEQTTRE